MSHDVAVPGSQASPQGQSPTGSSEGEVVANGPFSRSTSLDAHPPWVLAMLGAFVCLLLYLPTATWDYVQVSDARATAIGAWTLAERGSIEVDTNWPDVPWAEQGPDGDYYVWRHPGGMVWSALFYLPIVHGQEATSATEIPYGPATVSVVIATALGVGVMIIVLRRLVSARVALFGGLLLGLGTGNWSVSADGPWNHGPTLLFLALGLWATARERDTWSGLAFAAAITLRPHVAVAPAALGLAAGWRRRSLRPVLVMGATSLFGLVAVVWFYDHFFGTPTLRPAQMSAFVSGDVNLTNHGWGMNTLLWFVDAGRGLFVFSPFLLLLLPAIRTGWRESPSWVRGAAVGAIAYAVIQTRADVFHAGTGFFGYRGPLEFLTLTTPLLAVAYEHSVHRQRRWREAFALTALASVVVFALGATVLDPIRTSRAHCRVQTYVGGYRPVEEITSGLQERRERCVGTPRDAPEPASASTPQAADMRERPS